MSAVNLTLLHKKIEHIRFGILRVMGNPLASLSNSLIETIRIDDDGQIWCISSEKSASLFPANREFRVSLKYIHKEDGVFIRLTGLANTASYTAMINEQALDSGFQETHTHKLIIRIRITDADVFKKKILSRYTSVLQSVFKFSLKNLVPHST